MTKTVKRSLLIGINYTGTSSALGGCINDSINLKMFLKKKRYFKDSDFVMMNDKKKGLLYPTKRNIIIQLRNIVSFARKNISKKVEIFVAYSGHGSYMYDNSGDEKDGKDEVLCPIDCDTKGYITDDYLKHYFIDKLPKNVKLVMLIDACHSGTIVDLKYNYKIDRRNIFTIGKKSATKCDVVMISGCKDSQTSADAYLKNKVKRKYESQGAMTAAFLKNYKKNTTSYALITNMRKWLKIKHFDQIPQLSSGKQINTKKKFLLLSFK